ncbi:MAG: hypothetical protein R3B84_02230 [Zavarzinella sp.]
MKKLLSVITASIVLFAASNLNAAELKSGPQVGEKVPGPFHPLNINGEDAGEKACLFCKNGNAPVAMIFARKNTPELMALVKKIDAATESNKAASMGSFVVFLSDSPEMEAELKKAAKEASLKQCVLSIDNPAGPKGYNVAKDSDVTVVLYRARTVKANHAFKAGELNEKAIEKIVSEIPKILEVK